MKKPSLAFGLHLAFACMYERRPGRGLGPGSSFHRAYLI